MALTEGTNPPSVSLRDFIDEKFDHVDDSFAQHQREHLQHDAAHKREHEDSQKAIDTASTLAKQNKIDANEWRGAMNDRERTLATKVDIQTLTDAVNALKTAETKRAEREALRLVAEAEEKASSKDRQSATQWRTGLLVGLSATIGSVLINLVLRLMSA